MLDSSTSSGDALYRSMLDVRAPKRHGSGKTMYDGLLAMREDLDTYKETEMSPGRDR